MTGKALYTWNLKTSSFTQLVSDLCLKKKSKNYSRVQLLLIYFIQTFKKNCIKY